VAFGRLETLREETIMPSNRSSVGETSQRLGHNGTSALLSRGLISLLLATWGCNTAVTEDVPGLDILGPMGAYGGGVGFQKDGERHVAPRGKIGRGVAKRNGSGKTLKRDGKADPKPKDSGTQMHEKALAPPSDLDAVYGTVWPYDPNVSILVTWQDNSDTETGFEIQRAGPIFPSSPVRDSDFRTIAYVTAGKEEYRVSYRVPPLPYRYRVRAYARAGGSYGTGTQLRSRRKGRPEYSSWAKPCSAQQSGGDYVVPRALATPTNVRADVESSGSGPRVVVRWQDNARGESGFTVLRYDLYYGGDGLVSYLPVDGENTEVLRDPWPVYPGHRYRYTVQARQGDYGMPVNSEPSEYSRTVTIR
jgi:hypothetical protein